MREEPSAPELLGAVDAFLRDEVMPALDGRLAFHARVAANVLDIVRRELDVMPGARPREAARLAALLGRDAATGHRHPGLDPGSRFAPPAGEAGPRLGAGVTDGNALDGASGLNADALNDELCDAIAAGRFAHDDPALVAHLWATTLDTVAIDQPKYETYRRAAGHDNTGE